VVVLRRLLLLLLQGLQGRRDLLLLREQEVLLG
jgi:hypothetical protein